MLETQGLRFQILLQWITGLHSKGPLQGKNNQSKPRQSQTHCEIGPESHYPLRIPIDQDTHTPVKSATPFHFVKPPEGKNFTGKKFKRVRRGPDNWTLQKRINLRFASTGGVD